MFKKTKKEVIEMEQTTFVQKHAKKILIAGGVVVAAGAYVLLAKHEKEMKDVLADNALLKSFIEEDGKAINALLDENKAKDKEIGFIKFLVVESDCVSKALQNAENKLARKETKIQALLDTLAKCPNDLEVKNAISKHEAEAKILREQILNTIRLNDLIENDDNIYAK